MKLWNELSMKEKHNIIRESVSKGIHSLDDIKAYYDNYYKDDIHLFLEGGERNYQTWKSLIAKYKGLDIDNDNTYDYEGYYNAYPNEAWDMLNDNPETHFTDEFKTVYHPTFSNESSYNGKVNILFNPYGKLGGTWTAGDVFIPAYNLPWPNKFAEGGDKDENIYDTPRTFLGRATQVYGASPKVVRGVDVISSAAQTLPYGYLVGAMDLGYDLNRVYRKEDGAWGDVAVDAVSMLPFLNKLGLKASKTALNAIKGNETLRKAFNYTAATGKITDFINDTTGADQTSDSQNNKHYVVNLWEHNPSEWKQQSNVEPLVHAANRYEEGGPEEITTIKEYPEKYTVFNSYSKGQQNRYLSQMDYYGIDSNTAKRMLQYSTPNGPNLEYNNGYYTIGQSDKILDIDKTGNIIEPKYIGGQDYRNKVYEEYPYIKKAVEENANKYGINEEVLKYRLNHEGFIDQVVNKNNSNYKSKYPYSSSQIPYGFDPFSSFGLDDAGTYIENNKWVPLDTEYSVGNRTKINELGRDTTPAWGDTSSDNISLMASGLKYFIDEARKLYPNASERDLNRYALMFYNRGIEGGKKYIQNNGTGYEYSYGGPLVQLANRYVEGGPKGKRFVDVLGNVVSAFGITPKYPNTMPTLWSEVLPEESYTELPTMTANQIEGKIAPLPNNNEDFMPDFTNIKTKDNFGYNIDNLTTAYHYFKDNMKLNDYLIASLLANGIAESGFDPKAHNPKTSAKGLYLWLDGRYKYSSNKMSNTELLNELLQYINDTLNNTEDLMSWHHGGDGSGYNKAVEAHDKFYNAKNLYDAVHSFTYGYNRPDNVALRVKQRYDLALKILERLLAKQHKDGGKIYIKPENRGKFTALKKRTGHSASWFKAHGTPALKKMATFALNAKKWKHNDGGYIDVPNLLLPPTKENLIYSGHKSWYNR